MENESYYTTLAQVLPVIALAGALEVRWMWAYHVRLQEEVPERLRGTRSLRYAMWFYEGTARAASLGCALTFMCAFGVLGALKDEKQPGGFTEILLRFSVPFAGAVIVAPLVMLALTPRATIHRMLAIKEKDDEDEDDD